MEAEMVREMRKRPHVFTKEEDEYLLENWLTKSTLQLAFHLGLEEHQIVNRISTLRQIARDTKDKRMLRALGPKNLSAMQEQRIEDGYDDIPYWMRVSTRDQHLNINLESGRADG
jgi:hypothetical protein